MNENDDIINQINNGLIFNKIKLDQNITDKDNVNNISDIKNTYSQTIDE